MHIRRVDHPNIVCLKDLYDAGEKFLFVMELYGIMWQFIRLALTFDSRVTGGELFDRIVEKGFYTEDDAKQLVKKIVSGVAYLHLNGIAHRDLKVRDNWYYFALIWTTLQPENLLLKTKENDFEVKIADFGIPTSVV